MDTIIQKFKQNYSESETGCWNWNGLIDHKGYGRNTLGTSNGISARAHRASWQLHFGEIPNGMLVCHKCDVRNCVNPNHLFIGSNADNLKDMVNKNRSPLGEKHWKHKMTDDEIELVRLSEFSGRTLAKLFGVSESQISNVRHNRRRIVS